MTDPGSMRGSEMRWEALFADLDARAEALERRDRDLEITDRARIETAAVRLCERLAASVGAQLRLRCVAGCTVAGRLAHVGSDWLLVDEGSGRESLVPSYAVLAVGGLSRRAQDVADVGAVATRLGTRHVLRGIARDRSAVRIALADATTITGTIDRVGADFVDIAVHPPGELRRRGQVVDTTVVALHALVAVCREAG